MQRILTSALCCALMLLAQSALATPDAIAALIDSKSQTSATNKQDDALGSFMDDKQLLERLGDRASSLVNTSMGFLGMPYRLGGNGEQDGGVDCSGFVRAVYQRTLGKVLPRRAAEQADATKTIQKDELQPGDLVFFNTMHRAFSHVGIYIGNNQFIHSPRTGSVVRVEDMGKSYWQSRFNGARRVDTTQNDSVEIK
ncbi:MAG: C40 family peptidase [Brachymonas sp.]|jgi:cell wall-associated NlpC family hydrolase